MYLINGKKYEKTNNAFEADLLIYERSKTGAMIFKTYLKEIIN